MKFKLKKPLSVRGESIKELDLNLDDLTGLDLIEVEKYINETNDGRAILFPEYSKNYLIAVAARALKLPYDALKVLSARDFTRIAQAVQNFLTRSDLETEDASISPGQDGTETHPQKS